MISKTGRNINWRNISIKRISTVILAFLILIINTGYDSHYSKYQTKTPDPVSINIAGYLGKRMHDCIENRIKAENVQALIQPFKNRNETRLWQTEFWGKWMLGAVPAYQYSGDKQLLASIANSVKEVISTQSADGYIGNYADNAHLKGWDVWGRKYTLMGLLAYYDISHDKSVLTSAKHLADHLLSEVGPGKADIAKLGSFRGMPACSVLEPIIKLYEITHEKRYLDFAQYIVDQWETPDGPGLISKALNGIDVAVRFPHPKNWWSWENGQKAYEMMSCYQGLLELYKVTGVPDHLKAAEYAAQNIISKEINITGSGSAFECWYHGAQYQTIPTYHMMETCVTITWMRLCQTLLQLTHKAQYADMIEKTFYNAYLSALSADGVSFSKYSPLEGIRGAGEDQCGMQINCCIANGPRGFALLPETIVTSDENGVFVNLYTQSTAVVSHISSANKIIIDQQTSYPIDDSILINVDPEKEENFPINFRIPSWSKISSITLNGKLVDDIQPGIYKKIKRLWNKGDKVVIKLDMRGKIAELNNHIAIQRGPIVLARDARLNNTYTDQTTDLVNGINEYVNLKQDSLVVKNVWMSFSVPMLLGTNKEREFGKPKIIHLCDFSSAGNTWDQNSHYKVWLSKTLNVMDEGYKAY